MPRLLLILGALLLGALAGCSSDSGPAEQAACDKDYWVATDGNDEAASGGQASPFGTIERARLAVRADPLRGQCTLRVNIRSGTYALRQPLVFDADDSGSARQPVIYQAAPGNTAPVRVSGGIEVAGFNCTGADCVATVNGLPQGVLPRQFYVNGQRSVRARSNPGAAVNPAYIRVANGYLGPPLTHPELVEAVTLAQWKMMRCPVASYSTDTLVMQNPCWNNANSFPVPWNFQLLSWLENAPEFLTEPNMWYLDPYARTLRYKMGAAGFPKAAVLPVLESLLVVQGQPGRPVTDITFKGLVFSYATWTGPNTSSGYVADQSGMLLQGEGNPFSAIGHQKTVFATPGNIRVRYARGIAFEDNEFSHLGGVALSLGEGSQGNRIVNNVFTDIASSAIQVGGVSEADARPNADAATRDNLVQNNDISFTGQDYYDSAGIFVGFTAQTTIRNNTIRNTPWSAIAIGWGWGLLDPGGFPGLPHATPGMWGSYTTPTVASGNRIVSNRFSAFLEKLWDGGAIYANGAQGTGASDGLLIQLNVAENKRPAAAGNIFYTDGGARFITLDQNVSLNNPVGTVDFGPCGTGSSLAGALCLTTGVLPYGADMGGCLPVGDLAYTGNHFFNTVDFFGPQLCQNTYIPPAPVNVTMSGNVPVRSAEQVPAWILRQAGRQ